MDGYTHSSCRAGVWTKLPPTISLNPDLTKDLQGRTVYQKSKLFCMIWSMIKMQISGHTQMSISITLLDNSPCEQYNTENILRCRAACTYRETTSDGKAWGTDRTFSHSALSLVQVHPAGHLACLTLRPSARIQLTAATQSSSVHPFHPATALPGYPIARVPVEDDHSRNFPAKKNKINPSRVCKARVCKKKKCLLWW